MLSSSTASTSRQMLSACSGSFRRRYRSAFSSACAIAEVRIVLSSSFGTAIESLLRALLRALLRFLLLLRLRRRDGLRRLAVRRRVGLAGLLGERLRARALAADLAEEPRDRIVVPIHDALLERDDAVVGDVDV